MAFTLRVLVRRFLQGGMQLSPDYTEYVEYTDVKSVNNLRDGSLSILHTDGTESGIAAGVWFTYQTEIQK